MHVACAEQPLGAPPSQAGTTAASASPRARASLTLCYRTRGGSDRGPCHCATAASSSWAASARVCQRQTPDGGGQARVPPDAPAADLSRVAATHKHELMKPTKALGETEGRRVNLTLRAFSSAADVASRKRRRDDESRTRRLWRRLWRRAAYHPPSRRRSRRASSKRCRASSSRGAIPETLLMLRPSV
jgi:hypothetical protein